MENDRGIDYNPDKAVSQTVGRTLRALLKESGAVLTGYADLREVTEGRWSTGVSAAVAIPVEIAASVSGGPNREYYRTYCELNAKLDTLARKCETYLKEAGYNAYAQTTDVVKEYGNYRTWLPHKTVATLAGLGWIGKNALLVTKEYGSAVRITSVLTDAPLETGNPIRESRCGSCPVCTKLCPAGAISGKLWNDRLDRDEFVDIEACRTTARQMAWERVKEEITLCGICISGCPYTKNYLRRSQVNTGQQPEGLR